MVLKSRSGCNQIFRLPLLRKECTWKPFTDGRHWKIRQKREPPGKNLSGLWAAFFLAEEMGAVLG